MKRTNVEKVLEEFKKRHLVRRNQTEWRKKNRHFYLVWKNMRIRCKRKSHPMYKNYGGRGIKICKEWNNFENFKRDNFAKYQKSISLRGRENTSIDRIDNDGDYCPGNVRFVDYKVQASNRRSRARNISLA